MKITTLSRLGCAAALGLALAASPAAAIDVSGVEVRADVGHVNYVGPCPATVTFTGAFRVDGPGTVTIRWVRSDGAFSAPTPLRVAAAGLETVTTTWSLGDYVPAFQPFKGWEKLQVTGATRKESPAAPFTMTCQKPSAPPGRR